MHAYSDDVQRQLHAPAICVTAQKQLNGSSMAAQMQVVLEQGLQCASSPFPAS